MESPSVASVIGSHGGGVNKHGTEEKEPDRAAPSKHKGSDPGDRYHPKDPSVGSGREEVRAKPLSCSSMPTTDTKQRRRRGSRQLS